MQEVKDLISRRWIDKLHNEHDKEIYTMAVRHMLDCVDEVEIDYTLTNADRIRAMDDEELADYLYKMTLASLTVVEVDSREIAIPKLLKWLQSEAE